MRLHASLMLLFKTCISGIKTDFPKTPSNEAPSSAHPFLSFFDLN